MRNDDMFVGGQFTWFMGVIEDRDDPLEMNRVRVRCFGYHTDDLGSVRTKDLPWATVMLPTTSAGTSGIGSSPHGLMNGSWVIGFFRDGPSAQDPIVMGSVASSNESALSKNRINGFTDPTNEYPKATYADDVDVNKAARTDKYVTTDQYKLKETGLHQGENNVKTASPPKVSTVAVDADASYYAAKPWEELNALNDHEPEYPFNKVIETESGHLFEVDDTPGNERLNTMHTSGTFEEIYNDGSRNVKIVGDDYEIIIQNKNIFIKGNMNMTVAGDLRQLVYGNYHLEVEKDYTINVKGSRQTKIGGNEETEIVRNRSTNVGINDNLTVIKDQTINILNDQVLNVSHDLTSTISNDYSITTFNDTAIFASNDFSVASLGNFVVVSDGNITYETTKNMVENIGGTHDITVTGQQTFQASNLDIKNDVDITGTSTATTDHISNGISGHGHIHTGSPTAPTGAVSDTGTPTMPEEP